MSVPFVKIQKTDFQTGSVGSSPVGVLAIISPANSGPVNTPTQYSRDDLAFDDFGPSELVEDISYTLKTSGNPAIGIRPTTATEAVYGSIDTSHITGSMVPSAGTTHPADNYDVVIGFPISGTIGASGLQWTYTLDNGTPSAPQALPTGSAPITITVPNFPQGGSPGVSFSLAAGTVNAGDFFECLTTHKQVTDTDLPASLEALRTTTLPWEAMLIDQNVTTATVGIVDSFLEGLEAVGKFKMAFLNTRFKNQASSPPETETDYATAVGTIVSGSATSIRLSLCADGGKIPSTLTGLTQARKAALFEAARAMEIPIGEEPAWVGRGPLDDVVIIAAGGKPLFHNEELFETLDQLNVTTLRTINGETGSFVTNGRIFSTVGSDYVLVPHVRTINRACEIAYQILRKFLSKGVGKKPPDPTTGLIYIDERSARAIEGAVNEGLIQPMENQVQGFDFSLSRTDDLSANTGAFLTGDIAIEALAYIKGFMLLAHFARSIKVAA